MSKERVLTQKAFDSLLHWLDPERERAGQKYEAIRARLIKIFTCRGCREAEEMADETINRVTLKLPEIAGSYVGDPALYFYGVAQKIHLEYVRKRPAPKAKPPASGDAEDIEPVYECLERCLEQLTPENRRLVLRYYQADKHAKIDSRKELAQQMGVALNALRLRVFRIRSALQVCVLQCMQQKAAG